MRNIAIVLAAGAGSRMQSDTPKQYMEILGKPVLYYSLAVFEQSPVISDIVLVTRPGEEEYCRRNFIKPYGFGKVRAIVAGGEERYLSVYQGIQVIKEFVVSEDGLVFIHDGARPCLSEEVIERLCHEAQEYDAAIAGVPVKDTIKMVDTNSTVEQTPDRKCLWQIQTPQVFKRELIITAYEAIMKQDCSGVTDDAMVVETVTGTPVHVTMGAYENMKITTQEDVAIAEVLLRRLGRESPEREKP